MSQLELGAALIEAPAERERVAELHLLAGERAQASTAYASALRQHIVFTGYHQGMLEDAIAMCVRLGDSLGHNCVPTFSGPLKGSDAAYAAKELARMRKDVANRS